MKELKKVLLVCLFSFICLGFVNVSAKEYTITYNHNTDEYEAFQSFLNDYPQWQNYDYVYNIAKNLADTKLNTTYKMVFISFKKYDSGYYTYNSKNYTPVLYFYGWNSQQDLYYRITVDGAYFLYGSSKSQFYYLTESYGKSCNIYHDGTTTSCTSNGSYYSVGYNQLLLGKNDKTKSDTEIQFNSYESHYETLIYLNVDYTEELIYSSSDSNNYILPSGAIIGTNREPLKFTDIYSDRFAYLYKEQEEENVCENRTAVLGAVSNVNEIKLNVKGDTSALAEPLKGTFTLKYTSAVILNADMFLVEFVNNSDVGVVGNYNFKCATDSNNCYLNYEYNTEDDITETADFSFKIRSADSGIMPLISIYACTTSDDYTGISYNYSNGPSDSTTNNPNLDNYLNDLTPPSSDISSLGNIQGILPEGPVDGLLNIPFKVMSILIDGFNGTCQPISFNFVFDMPLTYPCVGDELYEHMDSTLMLFVNVVPTAFMLIRWFKSLYIRVQRATSLETTTDDEWGGI